MRPSFGSSKSANINSINRLRRLNRIRNKRFSKQFPIPRNFDHARARLGIVIGEANLQNNLRRSRAFNYAGRSCSIVDGPNDEHPAHHITSWVYNEDHICKCSQPENLGPPKYQCKHCKAWMWYEERTNINRPTTNPVFSLCCKKGTIKLPALQYPLLFPYGEDGYHSRIPYSKSLTKANVTRSFITMKEYYCYQLQHRDPNNNALLHRGRLFQQYCVDSYSIVRDTRLHFLKREQQLFRIDAVSNVRDAVSQGDLRGDFVRQRIVFPASFTGSPRYYGFPTLFITFTCNAQWPEIQETLQDIKGQKAEDRSDIVCRVFRIKLKNLIDDLTKNRHFGEAVAISYTIEYQKRGLPHAHILLWLKGQENVKCGPQTDQIISAEIPDMLKDLVGYNVVANYIMHGPCGLANLNAQCMHENKCQKRFPKAYQEFSTTDGNGFPLYRRRETQASVVINNIPLDNMYVVPHDLDFVVKYQAHINVELCSQSRAIKYLFKYINKGPYQASAILETTNHNPRDEIKQFLDCRYLTPHEACWRIFEFEIHHREPAVQRLPIHLPEQQNIYFHDSDRLDDVIDKMHNQKTMFTEWMETNKMDEQARTLLYADFPTEYGWNKKTLKWNRRKKGRTIGATSYESLKTVHGVLHNTFKEACHALGLLGDDKEWKTALEEASIHATSSQLRLMIDDIEYGLRNSLGHSGYIIQDTDLKNYLLISLQELLRQNASSLIEQNLPLPGIPQLRDRADRLN
ncbi:hypothetical protein COLO4_33117 [Corchorus olitorius]|uniref:Helitron helicase-like domain-containing protein n=1 Tax=Corchorus olitorius TaxID=93759 RepID=A0A1R3GWC2_9ROSI|nr:hypothetical protein COLO4_33117 [Corchorus olitorius]